MKRSIGPAAMPADGAPAAIDWSATEPWVRFGARSIGIFFIVAASGYLVAAGAYAVIAQGRILVEGAATTVSAARGGEVVEIKVRSGDFVNSGDPLLVLADTEARAELAAVSSRLGGYAIQVARLVAQRDLLDGFEAPKAADLSAAAVAKLVADEQAHFAKQRDKRSARERDLPHRLADFDRKLATAGERLATHLKDRDLNEREMSVVGPLYDKGSANPQRVGDLQRQSVRIGADITAARAGIAKLKAARGEAASQLDIDRQQDQQRAAGALRELTVKISEATEAKAALLSLSEPITVAAPATGFIFNLTVAAAGDLVRQGGKLAEVIAGDGGLLLGVAIDADDAVDIGIGNPVTLQLKSDGNGSIEPVSGFVRAIRPSTNVAGSGAASSVVLVETSHSGPARGAGVAFLRSGQLVEAQFAPQSSTLLSDLLAPLWKLLRKNFRSS